MPSTLTYRSCLILIVNIYWFLVQERPGQRGRHHITDRLINFLVQTKGCDISGTVIECPTLAICGKFIAVFVLFSPPILGFYGNIGSPFNIQILQIPSFLYLSDERMRKGD